MQRVARITVLLAVLFASYLSSQQPQPPLAGFRVITFAPLTYADGSNDRMRLIPYLSDILLKQGWQVVPFDNSGWLDPSSRERSNQMMVCAIDHDAMGVFRTTARLSCFDVLGTPLLNISENGSGSTERGFLQDAMRKLAARLRAMRPVFDSSKTVDLLDRMPRAEVVNISEADVDKMASQAELRSPIEGIWVSAEEPPYRLAIVRSPERGEFAVVVVESRRNILWQPQMLKARLSLAADRTNVVGTWWNGLRREVTVNGTLQGGELSLRFVQDGTTETIRLVKIKPALAEGSRTDGPNVVTTSGTGFVCDGRLVATNFHVIDGATKIEFAIPGIDLPFEMSVAVADPVNDLAILRLNGDRVLPPALQIIDTSDILLGSEGLVVGFPLGDELGLGHKVTVGVISALEGLKGDPRMFQFTAPIQPGSSGSPLLDQGGRVIGVVTATLGGRELHPQNVNFAMKGEYLALLLRRVSGRSFVAPVVQSIVETPQVVDRVRASVGRIVAYR